MTSVSYLGNPSNLRHASPLARALGRGIAGRFVNWLRLVPAGNAIVIARVSAEVQRGKLKKKAAHLRRMAKEAGHLVVLTFEHVCPAHGQKWLDFLDEMTQVAKEKDAFLLAETADRFARHPKYHPKYNSRQQAGLDEWFLVMDATEGIVLATVADPKSDSSESKSAQIKMGIAGPKSKKQIRKKKRPLAIKLFETVKNKSAIAKRLNVPRKTVVGWLRE